MKTDKERRSLTGIEFRADDERRVAVGYASVFNSPTEIAGLFMEEVAPGAFTRAIKEDDVRALVDHDPSMLLGRNKAGTLRLSEDKKGLRYEIDLPSTSVGEDVRILLDRGDLSSSSFGFRVRKEEWNDQEGKLPLRRILEVDPLFDVSVVTFPAYDEAEAALRSLEASRIRTVRKAPAHIRRRLRMEAAERGVILR